MWGGLSALPSKPWALGPHDPHLRRTRPSKKTPENTAAIDSGSRGAKHYRKALMNTIVRTFPQLSPVYTSSLRLICHQATSAVPYSLGAVPHEYR